MMEPYPECAKMTAVRDRSQEIGEFIEWLQAQGIHLAEWRGTRPCEWESLSGDRKCIEGDVVDDLLGDLGPCEVCDGTGVEDLLTPVLEIHRERIESLLARFFDIDLDLVEQERRSMLDTLQKIHAKEDA